MIPITVRNRSRLGIVAGSGGAVAQCPDSEFANHRGKHLCELRNQRDTGNFMMLVPLFEPEVRNRVGLRSMCELRVRGTSAASDLPRRYGTFKAPASSLGSSSDGLPAAR